MRFVIASRYDSGGTYLESYHIILEEMLDNSMPRRVMRQCMLRSLRYALGRRSSLKNSWLRVLSKHVFTLPLGHDFQTFKAHLEVLVRQYGYHPSLFDFRNDANAYVVTVRPRPTYHVPGDPLVKVTYRGPRSRRLYQHLRRKYNICTSVYRHDRYYGSRHLCQKGVERESASIRKVKRLAQ